MKVLGVMSGTSLDGLDLALVEFGSGTETDALEFDILASETVEYSDIWVRALKNAPTISGKELTRLDADYGRFIGEACRIFLEKNNVSADLIASHGHTVFHEPQDGYTLQIGKGVYIAERAGIATAYDFRSADLAQGGHGAPLVPVGDLLLFSKYDCCVNLGGIANLSRMHSKTDGIGFDICPFNILLNHYSQELGFAFDKGGEMARKGIFDALLFETLNAFPFYSEPAPKSLDKEAILKTYLPVINQFNLKASDVLNTLCRHFAFQVGNALDGSQDALITGGGAFNDYFMDLLAANFSGILHKPSKQLIEFKEAVIFSLLGYLRYHGGDNILKAITGGHKNLSSGILINV